MKKLILSALVAAALTGCASFPANYEQPVTQGDVAKEMHDAWQALPAIQYQKSNVGVAVRKSAPIPDSLAKRPVKLQFQQGAGTTVGDLLYALQQQGYRVASRLVDSKDKELSLTHFNGTLGSLMADLAAYYNLSYEYRNGVLFLTESARYSVALPQYKELLEKVEESLKELKATHTRVDVQAGMLYYEAAADDAATIEDYLAVIGRNSAMVKLQVAVLTVSHNRNLAMGFDWAQLLAQHGAGDMSPGRQLDANSATGATVPLGSLLSFTGGSGLSYTFTNDAFSLSAAVKALSTYGSAKTEQNVILDTVSGSPVKISSGNDIPYVKSVGSATTSGGSTTGNTETATVNSGLKVDITPNFDATDLTVTTKVNVDMSALVGFRELKAGSQVGSLSQPEIQKLTFENIGRLKVGETLVVGGISYDQLSNNYTNLPGMERSATGSQSDTINRHSIYIVIRPTVVAYVPDPASFKAKPVAAVEPEGEVTIMPYPNPVKDKAVKPRKTRKTKVATVKLPPALPPAGTEPSLSAIPGNQHQPGPMAKPQVMPVNPQQPTTKNGGIR